MQLTQNFTKSEFDSKDGAVMPQEVLKNIKELARNLQVLRDVLGKRITINSGYRSPAYNAQIRGAASNSQHMYGRAADIVVQGIAPEKVAQTIETLIAQGKMKQGGLAVYDSFVHYDIRGQKARWDYRLKKK
ncbi:YcbK family protein [Capnocytophaga canis]|uniref:YcbK family protein n=1 Tax=Capnocytophaga canis TaxID=1848903 RepID=UPI00370D9996